MRLNCTFLPSAHPVPSCRAPTLYYAPINIMLASITAWGKMADPLINPNPITMGGRFDYNSCGEVVQTAAYGLIHTAGRCTISIVSIWGRPCNHNPLKMGRKQQGIDVYNIMQFLYTSARHPVPLERGKCSFYYIVHDIQYHSRGVNAVSTSARHPVPLERGKCSFY